MFSICDLLLHVCELALHAQATTSIKLQPADGGLLEFELWKLVKCGLKFELIVKLIFKMFHSLTC